MKDVALMAGVSIKTVSRFINNEYLGKEETKAKVANAIEALNFVPSKTAQRLASAKTFTIGLAYRNPNAYYVIDLQTGLMNCFNDSHYELFILPCSSENKITEEEFIKLVTRSELAGLVLTPPFSENESIISALNKLTLPFVRIVSGEINSHATIEAQANRAQAPCIFLNDKKAAFQATEYLIERGHRHIGFLGGNIEHQSSKNRLLGYQQALSSNDIGMNENSIIEESFSFNFGVEGTKKLLQSLHKPSAIIAANDEIAAGVIFTAQQLGIKVPESLAIIGFENSPFSMQTFPALTTLAIPGVKMATLAGKLLIEQIKQECSKVNQVEFTPEMIIRHSTEGEQILNEVHCTLKIPQLIPQ